MYVPSQSFVMAWSCELEHWSMLCQGTFAAQATLPSSCHVACQNVQTKSWPGSHTCERGQCTPCSSLASCFLPLIGLTMKPSLPWNSWRRQSFRCQAASISPVHVPHTQHPFVPVWCWFWNYILIVIFSLFFPANPIPVSLPQIGFYIFLCLEDDLELLIFLVLESQAPN